MEKPLMSTNEKWKMFKNLIHNEMGLTQDDIRGWIQEAAVEQARLMVAQTFKNFNVEDFVKRTVVEERHWGSPTLQKEIKDLIAKELVAKISIGINK